MENNTYQKIHSLVLKIKQKYWYTWGCNMSLS